MSESVCARWCGFSFLPLPPKERVPECDLLTYPCRMTPLLALLVSAALLAIGCRTEELAASPEPAPIEHNEGELPELNRVEDVQQAPESDEQALDLSSTPAEPDEAGDAAPSPDAFPSTGRSDDLAAGPARDLAAELNAAVGVPSECLVDLTRATPTTIRVSVSALVRPSGAIIQPTASGTGLSRQAEQCVARRVDAVVLKPLDGDASQRVSTVIEIPYEPPREVVGTKVGAPDPELRNVREPLPPRREAAPSGRPIQEPTSRPIQEPSSRPIQEPSSRKPRGPKPRPIDGWDVDESAKDWR